MTTRTVSAAIAGGRSLRIRISFAILFYARQRPPRSRSGKRDECFFDQPTSGPTALGRTEEPARTFEPAAMAAGLAGAAYHPNFGWCRSPTPAGLPHTRRRIGGARAD